VAGALEGATANDDDSRLVNLGVGVLMILGGIGTIIGAFGLYVAAALWIRMED
jgi:hypothetical protein